MKRPSQLCRCLIVAALVAGQGLCVGFGPPTLKARDFDETPLWPGQVRQLGRAVSLELDASAALLLDVATHAVLYEKNARRRLAPASTTKIMTGLVALEWGSLDDRVSVEAGDLGVGTFIGLSPGEVWTLEDLLYALLLPSDNAVAVVVARHVAGSEAGFVRLMNEQAAKWGLRDTHFTNPHGFDDPQHWSTASDLAQIVLRGLEDPVFARIVGTRERQVGARRLVNLNQLLGTYEGAEGVKTGTTDVAGQCLISVVRRRDGRALSVVLGSADRYGDSRLLLDHYFATYRTVSLGLGPKGLNRVVKPDGKEGVLVLREQREVLLPRWKLPFLRVHRISSPSTTLDAEGVAGTARFALGTVVLAELPLYVVAP